MKNFPKKYFFKVWGGNYVICLIAVLISVFIVRHYYNKLYENQVAFQLQESLKTSSEFLSNGKVTPLQWCKSLSKKANSRYTLIDSNGTVICDTNSKITEMNNHAKRPEIQSAFLIGQGKSIRYSDTLGVELIYSAIRLDLKDSKLVLRKAIPVAFLKNAQGQIEKNIILFLLVILIPLGGLILYQGISYSKPMGELLSKANELQEEYSNRKPGVNNHLNDWDFLEWAFGRAHKSMKKQKRKLGFEKTKLAVVLESLSFPVLSIYKDQVVLFNNKIFKDYFASSIQGELKKQVQLWDIFHDAEILNAFSQCMKFDERIKLESYKFKIENQERYFDIIINPIIGDEGQVIGAFSIFYDVTKAKLIDKMRIDFVANVSHEVRTPITAIKGSLDILSSMEDKIPEDAKVFLNKIVKNNDRILRLFNDLLDLSILESKYETYPEWVQIKNIASNLVSSIKSSYSAKNINIKIEGDDLQVMIDPKYFEQVLVNLTENAFKYTPSNGDVLISWGLQEKSLIISVTDSGPGIPIEYQERVFERFFRVDPSRSRDLGGTGLGLSIVKHIAQILGGKVWVDPDYVNGSRFVFSIENIKSKTNDYNMLAANKISIDTTISDHM